MACVTCSHHWKNTSENLTQGVSKDFLLSCAKTKEVKYHGWDNSFIGYPFIFKKYQKYT